MTLLYRTCRVAAWTAFKLLGRTEVIGYEHLPREGGVIVASNHVSYLDPPLVGSTITRECAFMARHDLWQSRLLGGLISRLNAFPVHRDSADRRALRQAVEALKRGLVLVLFPEGTRSPNGMLQAAQAGLALIVKHSQAPVVPCAVVGPEKMLPPHTKIPRPTKLTVIFGDPVFFTPDAPREEIIETVMGSIAGLLCKHRQDLPPGDAYTPIGW